MITETSIKQKMHELAIESAKIASAMRKEGKDVDISKIVLKFYNDYAESLDLLLKLLKDSGYNEDI